MADQATALDAALAYADRGWPVFPVQTAPNKRPLTEHGYHDATTDHAQIIAWWSKWPAAQIGVACGAAGIVIVDLDEKPDADGHLQWNMIELSRGGANCGLCMKTPRGSGEQLFFADPERRFRRKIGVEPGVDLLGDGGYTIVPSPASPGRAWRYGDPFEVEDLVPAPDWLVELAGAQRVAEPVAGSATTLPATPLPVEQVEDIRAALACIPNDGRDEWLRVCFALKSTGAGEQAYALWEEWSRATPTGAVHPRFKEHDQRYTWEHATELRADGRQVNLQTLFWLAQQHGYQGPVPDGIEPVRIEVVDAAGTPAPAAAVEIPPTPPPDPAAIELMDWQDVTELPPIEWMVDSLLPCESLAMLAGDTEAGKSFGAIDLSMRIVHGLPWFGHATKPGDVLYLAGEGQRGLAARFRAWRYQHQHLGLDDGGRYCLVSSSIPVLARKTMHILVRLIEHVEQVKGRAPSLIVIDTLSQGLDDDENEAKVVAPVLRALVAICKRWGCCVLIVHHLVKLNQKMRKGEGPMRPTRDSIRGSGSLTRNIDTVLGLVVTDPDTNARELQVWKQKDGEKVDPIPLLLVQATTGRLRPDTIEETSCVLVQAPALPATPEQPKEAAQEADSGAKARERLQRTVGQVVEALGHLEAVEGPGNRGAVSSSVLAEACSARKQLALCAIKEAARLGLIKNVGDEKRPAWLLPSPSAPVPTVPESREPVPDPVPTNGSPS